MQLIRQELANNYEELKHTRSMIEADIRMSRMLKEANMELEAIPADTIEKYWEFFSSSAALNVDTDALAGFVTDIWLYRTYEKRHLRLLQSEE